MMALICKADEQLNILVHNYSPLHQSNKRRGGGGRGYGKGKRLTPQRSKRQGMLGYLSMTQYSGRDIPTPRTETVCLIVIDSQERPLRAVIAMRIVTAPSPN